MATKNYVVRTTDGRLLVGEMLEYADFTEKRRELTVAHKDQFVDFGKLSVRAIDVYSIALITTAELNDYLDTNNSIVDLDGCIVPAPLFDEEEVEV